MRSRICSTTSSRADTLDVRSSAEGDRVAAIHGLLHSETDVVATSELPIRR
jgi:hypothetical protein